MKPFWKSSVLIIVIGWFLGAASGLLISHYCHSMHPLHGRMRDRLIRELTLTPQQRTQVETIMQNSHQKMDVVYAQANDQMEDIRKATRTQIRLLLTPEQQTKFDQWIAKHQGKRLQWADSK